jgi:hypothetical protein
LRAALLLLKGKVWNYNVSPANDPKQETGDSGQETDQRAAASPPEKEL